MYFTCLSVKRKIESIRPAGIPLALGYQTQLSLHTGHIIVKITVYQGPKLTFLGRRQVATEILFQSPYGKMWSPKSRKKKCH